MSQHVLVNKGTAAPGAGQVLVNAASPASLTDGQLAIFNAETNAAILDNTANPTVGLIPFYVGMGVPAGRNPRISPVIKTGSVKKIDFKSYTAPVQPVYFVGYQGVGNNTLGFVTASGTATTSYGIKIENLVTLAPPFPKAYSQYTLRASVGTVNLNPVYVADQLAKDLNQQLSVMPSIDGGQFALVDVVSDLVLGTSPAGAGTVTGYTVTNNSATVTISGTTMGTTAATGLYNGCWVRIGTNATANLNPVYQVASFTYSATSIVLTLTRPFVGTSGTFTTATGVLVAANATTGLLPTSSSLSGLRISVTGSYFTSNAYAAGKLNTMINIPLLDTLAGTPINVGTAMVYGSGTVSEVLKKEMQALGNLGVENRIWMPLPNDTYAASNVATGGGSFGNGYSIFTLYYGNSVADKSAQGQGREETGMLTLCINNYWNNTNTVQDFTFFGALLANITGLPSGGTTGTWAGGNGGFVNW